MPYSVRGILLLAFAVWFAHKGYQRRRAHWTSVEWTAFAKGVGVAFAVVLIAMAMAFAVDLGIYDAVAASRAFRSTWVGVMMVLM